MLNYFYEKVLPYIPVRMSNTFLVLDSKQRNTKIILHPWLLGISTCVLSSAGFFIKFLWNLLPDCSTTVINWQFFITYIFCFSLKFGTYYIMGHWGELRMKNASLCLHVHFCHFLLFFTKSLCFNHFHFFVTKFHNRLLT